MAGTFISLLSRIRKSKTVCKNKSYVDNKHTYHIYSIKNGCQNAIIFKKTLKKINNFLSLRTGRPDSISYAPLFFSKISEKIDVISISFVSCGTVFVVTIFFTPASFNFVYASSANIA